MHHLTPTSKSFFYYYHQLELYITEREATISTLISIEFLVQRESFLACAKSSEFGTYKQPNYMWLNLNLIF